MRNFACVTRLSVLVLSLVAMSCGARLSKEGARKILNDHYAAQPVTESVQFRIPDADFAMTDPLMTPDFTIKDQAERVAKFAQRLLFATPSGQQIKQLFDQGLVTVRTEAIGDRPSGGVRLRFHMGLTDTGKKYQQRENTAYAGYNIFFVRIGQTVVDEVTDVIVKGNEATIYFTQRFGEATPFAAFADNFGRANTTPHAMTAYLVHDGKVWTVKHITQGSQ